MKINESLEEYGLLIKGVSQTIKNERNGWFFQHFLVLYLPVC